MQLVTLGDVRALARLYANQRSDAFMSPADWDVLIVAARAEFYDVLIAMRGHDYFLKPASLATSENSPIVALPADHYEVLTVFANWGTQQLEELRSLDHWGDQVGYRNWNSWEQYSPKAWRIRGNLLEFFPTPNRVTQLELRYLPTPDPLTSDASTFDSVNGWHKLVAARAALEALSLQNLPTAAIEKIYEREKERIEGLAADRAAANAPTIRDIYAGDRGQGWWRLPWPTGSG